MDPNWAKSLDPDPNSIYMDSQHWFYFQSVVDLTCMDVLGLGSIYSCGIAPHPPLLPEYFNYSPLPPLPVSPG